MMKRVLPLLLLLAACHRPIVYVPQEVAVPIPVPCPEPQAVERPKLPLSQIGPGSPSDQVVKAYAASIELLKGYAEQLEKILDGYRKH